MRYMTRVSAVSLLAWLLSFTFPVQAQNIWTFHNDNARTGANTNETILTPSNVNTNSFGKLFTYTVDGYIFAQPLYISNVAITNKGTHNVVFIATEGDTVYAFDADSNAGSNSTPLWKTNLLGAGETTVGTNEVGTTDVTPQIGITGTPVIDTNTGTLYCVAKSKKVSGGVTNYFQRLHALDITSGNERANSPALISASVSGTGEGNTGGILNFDLLKEHQRSALLLLSNTVYIVWASHGDNSPYHGWVMGYDKTTLAQISVFNASPNGIKTGIWQGGNGPAADTNGNFFFMTGNGTYDGPTNNDYGDSFIRLTTTNVITNLFLADYFTPYNQFALGGNGGDSDIGSGGPVVLPDAVGNAAHRHLLVGAGKGNSGQGGVTIYLVDRDNMGHYNVGGTSNPNIVQEVIGQLTIPQMSTPTYWNFRLYYVAFQDFVHAFSISNAVLSTMPVDSSTTKASGWFGTTMSISANGNSNGIIWVIDPYKGTISNSVLHAYNATRLTTELYNSAMAGSRDTGPGGVKFTVPTVVNGKVYVGGQSSLVVYGNGAFSIAPFFTSQPQNELVVAGNSATFSVSVSSGTNSFNTQWYFNSTVIPGATTTSYTISNAQTNNVGSYYVTVSNSFGSSTSSIAYLSVVSNSPGAVLAPSNIVDWWPADGNPVDLVSGNNGTLVNNVTYTNGESGQAFHFDGISSYVNLGAANLTPPWTLSVWAYRESSLSNGSIIMGDGSKYYIKLEQNSSGTNSYQVGITQLAYADTAFNYKTPSNIWTHLAFVASSSTVSLYANGAFQGSITTNNFPLPRGFMGTGSTGTKFINILHGALDDIQVYSRMLSPAEINSIYTAGSAGLVRAPQFTEFNETNGTLSLSFEGLTGKTFTIYSSTNLVTWTPVTTLANPGGTNIYAEAVTDSSAKFFRVSQP